MKVESLRIFTHKKCSELSLKTVAVHQYSKTCFLVQMKFITEDSEQTQTQILILNLNYLIGKYIQQRIDATKRGFVIKD